MIIQKLSRLQHLEHNFNKCQCMVELGFNLAVPAWYSAHWLNLHAVLQHTKSNLLSWMAYRDTLLYFMTTQSTTLFKAACKLYGQNFFSVKETTVLKLSLIFVPQNLQTWLRSRTTLYWKRKTAEIFKQTAKISLDNKIFISIVQTVFDLA